MSYIYFIHDKTSKAIKIGFSKNPNKRLKQLMTGSSNNLSLIYVVEGNKDVEYFLHKRFKDYRIHGEWFKDHVVLMWIEQDKLSKKYAI